MRKQQQKSMFPCFHFAVSKRERECRSTETLNKKSWLLLNEQWRVSYAKFPLVSIFQIKKSGSVCESKLWCMQYMM